MYRFICFISRLGERLQFLHTVICLSYKPQTCRLVSLSYVCVYTVRPSALYVIAMLNIKINFLHIDVQDLVVTADVCTCVLHVHY